MVPASQNHGHFMLIQDMVSGQIHLDWGGVVNDGAQSVSVQGPYVNVVGEELPLQSQLDDDVSQESTSATS